MTLKDVRRFQGIGIVNRSSGHSQRQLPAQGETHARNGAGSEDRRFLLLKAVTGPRDARSVNVIPIRYRDELRHDSQAQAETRMTNGSAESSVWNHARRIVERDVAIH